MSRASSWAPPDTPRILIDPSSHHLLNVGDLAMLQVCVERLQASLPQARLSAVTAAPELLAEHCPGVVPLPAAGRYALTSDAGPRLPRPRRLARAALARAGRWLARHEPAAETFANALLAADLMLLSGRGGLTDAFPAETHAMLTELEIASRIGLPAVLLGQGIGPIDDRRARVRMERTLPGLAFASLREGRAGPGLLKAMGVPEERIAITGDDAIELAFRTRQAHAGDALGLNVRVADYAGVAPDDAQRIGKLVRQAARERGAEVVSVGISRHPHEDERAAWREAGAQAPAVNGPQEAIAASGRCRVLVAGSYHAAVFALAQGVPVVGLAASPYYVDKFLGLRERFGDGCEVVRIDHLGAQAPATLEAELSRLWKRAPALRAGLLAAAESQVALSRAAHARAGAIATTAAQPARAAAARSS